jgi:hypothetical protein
MADPNRREEWEMTNEELNIKIAEHLGFYNIKVRWGSLSGLIKDSEAYGFMPIASFSTDMVAAMFLVKKAEKLDVGFDLYNGYISRTYPEPKPDHPEYYFHATFFDPWAGPRSDKYEDSDADPARAVALAYLKLMEAKGAE